MPTGFLFGFNGQEKDNEVSGAGNSYTAEFWQYDSRLGRRWNVDPIFKVWESPYACFNNNPIAKIDPSGQNAENANHTKPEKSKISKWWNRVLDKRAARKFDRKVRKAVERDFDKLTKAGQVDLGDRDDYNQKLEELKDKYSAKYGNKKWFKRASSIGSELSTITTLINLNFHDGNENNNGPDPEQSFDRDVMVDKGSLSIEERLKNGEEHKIPLNGMSDSRVPDGIIPKNSQIRVDGNFDANPNNLSIFYYDENGNEVPIGLSGATLHNNYPNSVPILTVVILKR